MAYRSQYHGRYSGIGAMLSRPWLQAKCVSTAGRMKTVAEGRSPRETGRYAESFSVVPVMLNVPFRGKPRLRAGARLVNTSDHASIVEWGNGRTPRYAVLSKTIDDLKAAHRA
ncbi:hypothetical protein [Streptomyces sp. NPDC060001]|uniref:hypothetical protein n=1 Tax=Streptomyces sp. NPDC060001 TaxID=3347032 RepID=UPI0036B3B012